MLLSLLLLFYNVFQVSFVPQSQAGSETGFLLLSFHPALFPCSLSVSVAAHIWISLLLSAADSDESGP